MNGEELLRKKMAEGWNIGIECKGKGRVYEMSYEGTAGKVEWSMEDFLTKMKHGVGDTLEEMLKNMFGNEL